MDSPQHMLTSQYTQVNQKKKKKKERGKKSHNYNFSSYF